MSEGKLSSPCDKLLHIVSLALTVCILGNLQFFLSYADFFFKIFFDAIDFIQLPDLYSKIAL